MVSLSDFNLFNMGGNKQQSPFDAAAPYYKKSEDAIKGFAKTYTDRGDAQYEGLNEQYASMMNDPAAFLEQIMGGYEQSSGYQRSLDEALGAASAAASAGGYSGLPSDQQGQGRLASSMMNDDMSRYIQQVLGIQDRGTGGSQGFYDQGYGAAKSASSDMSNLFGSQGSAAFGQARQDQQSQQDMQKMIAQVIGMAGGAAIGGPAGAAAGSSAASTFF